MFGFSPKKGQISAVDCGKYRFCQPRQENFFEGGTDNQLLLAGRALINGNGSLTCCQSPPPIRTQPQFVTICL